MALAWLHALSLGLLGVMLGSTPAQAQPFAYVTNIFADSVSVIDTASNTIVATVPVGREPLGVAITPDGTHAYMTNTLSNAVSVIDTATNTVVAPVSVGSFPFGVAITPDGIHAYVTNAGLQHRVGDRYGDRHRSGHRGGGE
jgi:YVTN family beta-propeller protein